MVIRLLLCVGQSLRVSRVRTCTVRHDFRLFNFRISGFKKTDSWWLYNPSLFSFQFQKMSGGCRCYFSMEDSIAPGYTVIYGDLWPLPSSPVESSMTEREQEEGDAQIPQQCSQLAVSISFGAFGILLRLVLVALLLESAYCFVLAVEKREERDVEFGRPTGQHAHPDRRLQAKVT